MRLSHRPNAGTNYVMWWPYYLDGKPVAGEENILFRFSVRLS